jgi:hypothetical protein
MNIIVTSALTASGNAVEGTLDIIWENNAQPTATPRYMVLFARYQNFKNGAQPYKSIVGTDALESYLIEVGFTTENARRWTEQVREGTISIPNVIMPEGQMAAYERRSA